MSINYDPDGTPEYDEEAAAQARELGLFMVCIICDDRGPDRVPVSFVVFVSAIPRTGERIWLEDGSVCEVKRVYHRVVSMPEIGMISLTPNVYAIKVDPDD